MPFTVIVEPTVKPVSVEMVKAHTNAPDSADDDLLALYLAAAVSHGEMITGRKFVEATFKLDLDAFPVGSIALRPNLQSVSAITYTDTDGASQTLDTSLYKVKSTGLVGYIEPVDSWPEGEDVFITFDAGWPLDVSENPTTPKDIVAWLLVKVADMYMQRESFVASTGTISAFIAAPKSFIDHLLDAYIVPGIGAGV